MNLRSPLLVADTSLLVRAAVELLAIAVQLPQRVHLSDEQADVLAEALLRFGNANAYEQPHLDAILSALFSAEYLIEKPPVTPASRERRTREALAEIRRARDEHLTFLANFLRAQANKEEARS